MNRIVITGADGFIGRRLVKHALSAGHEVAAMLHGDAANQFDDSVRVVRGDITDAESLRGLFDDCDNVIHLAGRTIGRSRHDYDIVNHLGTQNVARQCANRQTPPKLLFVSSLAAAGPAKGGKPRTEADLPSPVSDYGRSKRAAEESLLSMSSELPVQIVRPPSVFGDTDPYLLGLFKTARAGLLVLPGSQTARYSLIHVDDLVRALLHLAMRDDFIARPQPALHDDDELANPGVAFVSQDPALSFPQLAAVICETLDRKPPRSLHIPAPVCWAYGAANSLLNKLLGLRLLMNLDKIREGLAGDWMCDSSRLTDKLEFQFEVPLQQRIRETTECYQSKGWL